MDFSNGLSFAGIGVGAVIAWLSRKPMSPVASRGLLGFGVGLIAVGVWGMLHGLMTGGEAGAQKPPVSIEQTNPHNSPPIIGDRNTVTINPDVNPNAAEVTYDFNGERRATRKAPYFGIDIEEDTSQAQAFKKMAELEKERNWAALKDLCEQEMEKTPEWLTPFLLAGKVYAVLGDTDKAIEQLDYVHQKAAGREDYKIADRMREEIRRQTGR